MRDGAAESGHHAIINWISANVDAKVCFLNNCSPGVDPFEMCTEGQRLELAPRNILIYNYQDRRLSDAFASGFLVNKTRWFGSAGNSIYILILRDPFNNFASKYRWAVNGTRWTPQMDWVIHGLPELWKTYAREFLGVTHLMPAPRVFINYNRWFVDPGYREHLSRRLGLVSAAKGLAEVAKWGPNTWGDSFDNLDFEGRAHEMRSRRWRHFAGDPVFKQLFKDRDLLELSEEIFGVISGTSVSLAQPNIEMIQYREESRGVVSLRLYEVDECRAIVEEMKDLPRWNTALVRDARDASDYQVLTRPDIRSARTLVSSAAEDIFRRVRRPHGLYLKTVDQAALGN